MTNFSKAGLALSGALMIVFCFVKVFNSDEETQCKQTEWKELESIADIAGYGDCPILGRLYRIEVEGSEIRVPGPLQDKLVQWLQGDVELIKQSRKQRVIQITNRVRQSQSQRQTI